MKAKKRKIIKFGQKALVITLPQDFVKTSGLKKGDEVGIVYDSQFIIVSPNSPVIKK